MCSQYFSRSSRMPRYSSGGSLPLSSTPERRSDGDWTGLFLKGADGRVPQPLLDAFATFQSELRVFSAECDAFNEKAEGASFPHCFGLWCWNPKYLETSVSV